LATDDLEDDDEPTPTKKSRKTPKQIAEEKVARNRQRKQAKGTGEPVDRFRLITADERDAPQAKTKPTKIAQKPKKAAVATETGEDSQGSSTDAAAKKIIKTVAPSKAKSRAITAEERALLADITQAGKGDQDQDSRVEPESEKRYTPDQSTTQSVDEEEELRKDVLDGRKVKRLVTRLFMVLNGAVM
jgi:hypothetical protein